MDRTADREARGREGSIAASKPFWVRHLRRELQYAIDLGVLAAAFVMAYLLRFDFQVPEARVANGLVQLPLVMLLQFAALAMCGVYSFVWRYIGMTEIRSFVTAVSAALLPVVALRIGLSDAYQVWRVPLSVALIDAGLAFGGLLGVRVVRRALYERFERQAAGAERVRGRGGNAKSKTLLIGAGQAGVMAARELARQPEGPLDVLGFVDDDVQKVGQVIHGIKVRGTSRDLERLVRELGIEQVVITMARVGRSTLRRLVDQADRLGVQVRIVPGLFEILEGRVSVSRFRQVQIEDLLGREQVHLEEEGLSAFLKGRRVLVTGAGGSIGSELARQVSRNAPEALFLVDRAEPALFEIDQEIRDLWPQLPVTPIPADVGDAARMRRLLAEHRPSLLLHAAAHKHVPLMEAHPGEAIRNNTLATHRLGLVAGELGVDRFVLVSTDKAVRPASVMGASKRLAEVVIQDLDRRLPTRFLAVRFGNVLGSTGSVIPIFRKQIERGGPVTVTDGDMVRYFMTIPEAAQLVLQAASMGEGGEIFVLDMGEPVRILDLAEDMIRLAGLRPFEDIEIVFTGPRRGEKLFEELELAEEQMEKTRHPKIFIGRLQPYPTEEIEQTLRRLEALAENGSPQEIRAFLATAVPESNLDPKSS